MNTVKHIPKGFHAITPYLAVKDAKAAIEFYRRAFGAREVGRIAMPGGSPVGIAFYVVDVDATFQRALDAGATVIEPVKDQFYGDRSGTLLDPFGHKWHVLTHIENVSFDEMQRRCDAMFSAQQ